MHLDQIKERIISAASLCEADSVLRRMTVSTPAGVSPEGKAQRNAMLEISRKLIEAEMLSTLDDLVRWWISYRGGAWINGPDQR